MNFCPDCDKNYNTNFCPNCGQKRINEKLTAQSILTDFFNNVYALEKSLYSNIKCLLFDPHIIINRYLEGYRNYYFSPSKFFVVASVLIAINFIFTQSHFFILEIKESSIQENLLFLFIFILFLSLSSYFVYYLKWKKSFTEHIVINIYNICLWTIFFTPLSIINYLYIDNNTVSLFLLLVYIALIIIWNSMAFKIKSKWKRILYITLNFFLIGLIFLTLTLIS